MVFSLYHHYKSKEHTSTLPMQLYYEIHKRENRPDTTPSKRTIVSPKKKPNLPIGIILLSKHVLFPLLRVLLIRLHQKKSGIKSHFPVLLWDPSTPRNSPTKLGISNVTQTLKTKACTQLTILQQMIRQPQPQLKNPFFS